MTMTRRRLLGLLAAIVPAAAAIGAARQAEEMVALKMPDGFPEISIPKEPVATFATRANEAVMQAGIDSYADPSLRTVSMHERNVAEASIGSHAGHIGCPVGIRVQAGVPDMDHMTVTYCDGTVATKPFGALETVVDGAHIDDAGAWTTNPDGTFRTLYVNDSSAIWCTEHLDPQTGAGHWHTFDDDAWKRERWARGRCSYTPDCPCGDSLSREA